MRLDDGLTSSQINGERRARRRAKTTDLAAAMAKNPARRAWFDRWFDEKYPELARRRPAAEAAAAAHAPQAAASESVAEPVPAFDLEPRRLTAARLLLAGRCVSDVARSLGADRHTVSAWTRDPAFRREVRRMAVELPLDQLCPGAGEGKPRQSKRTHGARTTGGA